MQTLSAMPVCPVAHLLPARRAAGWRAPARLHAQLGLREPTVQTQATAAPT